MLDVEKQKKRQRAWNLANRDRIRARRRELYLQNKPRLLAQSKQYKADNHGAVLEWQRSYGRTYRKDNPAVARACKLNRRARERSAEGHISKKLLHQIRTEQGDSCAYCAADLLDAGHLDHKTPLSRGGNNLRPNLHYTCEPCNKRKGTKTHEEFVCLATAA